MPVRGVYSLLLLCVSEQGQEGLGEQQGCVSGGR